MTKISSSSLGLEFKALDLHVHTPASIDFKDKKALPQDIVNSALKANLDGICITDHNSAEWIDDIKEAAKKTNLTVFPGVEISVTGGKAGPVHIIGIFDPSISREELNDFLSDIGFTKSKRGKTDEVAKGDPEYVINKIHEHSGIPILAHCDSTHGVLHDMKGTPRTKVIQNEHLIAAEASSEKYRKILDGTDPTYKRFLPTYEASDAHSVNEIGAKRTYFRLENLTFDGLKQCFFDSPVRIRLSHDIESVNKKSFPRIVDLSVSQGFFANQNVEFHPCQNTLIGGQGVGKSLIVEYLRFALGQQSKIDDIKKDTDSKLLGQLGIGGKVSLLVELSNKTKYEITREFTGDSNPVLVRNIDTNEVYEGDVKRLFPILAYSQTEAIYIARNSQAQLDLIDGFINTLEFDQQKAESLRRLKENDHELVEIIDSKFQLEQVKRELSTEQEELSNIEKSLNNPVLKEMKKADENLSAFEKEITYHNNLIQEMQNIINELNEDMQPLKLTDEMLENGDLQKANEISKQSYDLTQSELKKTISKIRENKESIEKIKSIWMNEYQKIQDKYNIFLEETGEGQKGLESKRKNCQTKIGDLQSQVDSLSSKSEKYDDLLESRNKLLGDLQKTLHDAYLARKEKYDELTHLSDGKLKLDITFLADKTNFSEELKAIATGTNIRKSDLEIIANSISSWEFINHVINNDIKAICKATGISKDVVNKLVNWLNTLEAKEKVLSLQHQFLPEDIPSIKYKKEDGNYYEISDLSVGQKCTALIIIALSAGDNPIIIDQPEESIDIASVFSDIVMNLRKGKDTRQFILTTHNPNVAVTADSDLIHVLKSSATEGKVVNRGVIEDPEVRNEVIQHLEGGEDPYLLRGKKYGLLE